ncbi:hypothetical protein [Agriterribacter sp.]|uniref:hypothetical protein n=1 Tax=Agriterribacter sp. TaxID=2821509 RepID=UPI002C52829C|nr:hypothetical protein [Agriterribacter sp.]HRO47707.1 hypothetical protein [Agriterribacter sp.]HRQ18078.1 hypothetical protein [Agriterribacter sp.]
MTVSCLSQNESVIDKSNPIYAMYNRPNKNGITEEQMAWDKSRSGNAFDFMALRKTIDAINAITQATGERYWINQQVVLINNLIQTSQISSDIQENLIFRDEFKSWISLANNDTYHKEVPLYESYSFFYIMQFLYLIRNSAWIEKTDNNKVWWTNTLAFIEKHIWTKWYERSFSSFKNHYRYFLRSRTHMGSHWAGLALYLNALTANTEIKSQTAFLIQQYDTLLKRNLKVRQGGYIWNSTYDNVEGTFAGRSSESLIQDVSHGNHVVSYIIAAYTLGNKDWTIDDIKRLSFTLKEIIYDAQSNRFRDNVDGSASTERTGRGNFVADGWVKLAACNEEIKAIFQKFEKTGMLKKYNQELQFKANLYKIERNK